MVRFILLASPRTGSTWLLEMLMRNQEIKMAGELLNLSDKRNKIPKGGTEAVLSYVNQKLNQLKGNVVGFKVFPSQLIELNINLADLMDFIGASYLLILWRKSVLETCWSYQMAMKTQIWYTGKKNAEEAATAEQMVLSAETIEKYLAEFTNHWETIATQVPRETLKLFVMYENLLTDTKYELSRIFDFLRIPVKGVVVRSNAVRQHPSSIEQKMPNYKQLPQRLRDAIVDVPQIFSNAVLSAIENPKTIQFLPSLEPNNPAGGWRYTVTKPLITTKMKENVLDALDTEMISSEGPWPKVMASKLRNWYQVPLAQLCSNGFSALMLALQALNIGKGDEVVIPTFTMITVSNAVIYCGATPIFVDNSDNQYNPGFTELFQVVNPRTKAIIVCHTFGIPVCNMSEILNECESRRIWLIEDISECVGVTVFDGDGHEKLLGTFGHFSCASLHASKMIHSGDGGFVLSKLGGLEGRIASLVDNGFTPNYPFVHFEPCIDAKISGISAAVGCAAIDSVDQIMQHRSELAQQFRAELSEIPLRLMPQCGSKDTPWVFGIVCRSKEERTNLRNFLATEGIETRNFFFPLHLQPANSHFLLSNDRKFPNSELLGSCGFYLPTHSNLMLEDVRFICARILRFFELKTDVNLIVKPQVPIESRLNVLRLKPDSFSIENREFSRDGRFLAMNCNPTVTKRTVEVGLECERYLITEHWDEGQKLYKNIQLLITAAAPKDRDRVREYLQPYSDYIAAFSRVELPPSGPWRQIDLTQEPFSAAKNISTTTDTEVLQLLVFLIRKLKATRVLELGCWLGHATCIMAATVEENGKGEVVAVDEFRWQLWMESDDISERKYNFRDDFSEEFEKNIIRYKKTVKTVQWELTSDTLMATAVRKHYFDVVYVDFTANEEELLKVWPQIRACCIANRTVLVFNGIQRDSVGFFTAFAHELHPIAKPKSRAKAFLYRKKVEQFLAMEQKLKVTKKLKFAEVPDWQHLHNDAFCATIQLLKFQYHSDNAKITFIPAVEVYLCDNKSNLNQPWIGIVHGVPHYPEDFYVPDLNQLCGKKYRKFMKMCVGIFTLTEVQKTYLESYLPEDLKFPISILKYPFAPVHKNTILSQLHNLEVNSIVDVCFIGSFARDFQHFLHAKLPRKFRKILLNDSKKFPAGYIPADVTVITRLSELEYEQLLEKCVPFLSLKYDGAANTLVLECISRSVPLLAPRMASVVEYLGAEYPLLYEVGQLDFTELLTTEAIRLAIDYLKQKDKSPFSRENFFNLFDKSAVLANCSYFPSSDKSNLLPISFEQIQWKFDCSICICSDKRTSNLTDILNQLWCNQTFAGTIEVLVWNNNQCRSKEVKRICDEYIPLNSCRKSLVCIDSSRNFYSSVRMVLPTIARSDSILIFDEDVIPQPTFVEFFMSAAVKHPSDILCTRGHKFLPHQLDTTDPQTVWLQCEYVKVLEDSAVEQLIHLAYMDTCLMPKSALQQCVSVDLPDPTFLAVDNYWMSYVLSHKFSRNFRKLQIDNERPPFLRIEDSEARKLVMTEQPEVADAKIRLYIHHMLNGWPNWKEKNSEIVTPKIQLTDAEWEKLAEQKQNFWKRPFIGFNVSSRLSLGDAESLKNIGVSHVRIGAVGAKEECDWEFCEFSTDPESQLNDLVKCVEMLIGFSINVVLTLDSRVATAALWRSIAQKFVRQPRVIGYDLINDPVLEGEELLHCSEAGSIDCDLSTLIKTYKELADAIRFVDPITPLIIEPSFWAKLCRFPHFMRLENLKIDPILMTSLHFYEPRTLTSRKDNCGRFSYPSVVPKFADLKLPGTYTCDEKYLRDLVMNAAKLSKQIGIPLFLGELGIPREIPGAADYMMTVINACKEASISVFIYAFREEMWEAMNYEIPIDYSQRTPVWDALIKAIGSSGGLNEKEQLNGMEKL